MPPAANLVAPLATVEDMTIEWLTSALNGFATRPIATFTTLPNDHPVPGASSVGVRVLVKYHNQIDDVPAADASINPTHLFLKLPLLNLLENSPLVKAFAIYRREVYCYRDVLCPLRDVIASPMLYGYGFCEETHHFALLMEDVTAPHKRGKFGNRLSGFSEGQVASVVTQIASLHARYWNTTITPPTPPWEQPQVSEEEKRIKETFELAPGLGAGRLPPKEAVLKWAPAQWDNNPAAIQRQSAEVCEDIDSFIHFFKGDSAFPYAIFPLADRIAARYPRALEHILQRHPKTLIHGDIHMDNVAFYSRLCDESHATTAIFCDWQLAAIGSGLFDLGYYFASMLPNEERVKNENNYLPVYYEIISPSAGPEYTMERMLDAYKLCLILGFGKMCWYCKQWKKGGKPIDSALGQVLRHMCLGYTMALLHHDVIQVLLD